MTIDDKRPHVPKYKTDMNTINNIIARHYTALFKRIEVEFKKNPVNQARVRAVVQDELGAMNAETRQVVERVIEKAFTEGEAQTLIGDYASLTDEEAADSLQRETSPLNQPPDEKDALNKLKVAGIAALGLRKAKTLLNKGVGEQALINKAVDDVMTDLNKMDVSTETALVSLSRKVSIERGRINAFMQSGMVDEAERLSKTVTQDAISKRIVKEGMVGIVDKKGRRWKPGTYSKLVVKTKINDTYLDGVKHEGQKIGMDLGVISTHGAKDACRKWEGVIVSVNGQTPGYPTLDEAKASKEVFHPNCQHSVHMIRTPDNLSKTDQRINDEKRKQL